MWSVLSGQNLYHIMREMLSFLANLKEEDWLNQEIKEERILSQKDFLWRCFKMILNVE